MEKEKVEQIIEQYMKKIYGFAMKKAFSYDEAEDLCSEIVCEVYLSLLKANEVYNIEGYIWRISEHTYAKYVASNKKHEGLSLDGLQLPYYDTYSFENDDEEKARLSREVAYLNEARRSIVFQFYYESKPIQVISRDMGIPVGTVKWHLNRARIELKEGLSMERKIGNLGLNPIVAQSYGHSGCPGSNKGPESYLGDKLNLNIAYSVYYSPKSLEEIAQELGVTPVFIEDRIKLLESNGFIVKTKNNRYTTYVKFSAPKHSLELLEKQYMLELEIAKVLEKEFVPIVRDSFKNFDKVYIPTKNRELFEASVIFYALAHNCRISANIDTSKYHIKTTAGGDFIATIDIKSSPIDPEYVPSIERKNHWSCGSMTRSSCKYPSVFSWSIDSALSSRTGGWENNDYKDYEYIYEIISGLIVENTTTVDKFNRLREREFISAENDINIMIVQDDYKKFFERIPKLDKKIKDRFAPKILELASMKAKFYPTQMQDLIINYNVDGFIGNSVALKVMDIMYSNGTFKPLSERERVSSNLLMFCDKLPNIQE